MVMIYIDVSSEEIQRLFEESAIQRHILSVAEKLELVDIPQYALKDYGIDNEGYPKTTTYGSNKFDDLHTQILRIEYYTQAIADFINHNFSKILCNKVITGRVCSIVIKCVITHEMRHVWQFNNGTVNHEIIEAEKMKNYEERIYEKEAKNFTDNEISNIGELERLVIKVINNELHIDNDNKQEFMKFD